MSRPGSKRARRAGDARHLGQIEGMRRQQPIFVRKRDSATITQI
jgi:hypothetical protein